MKIGLVLALLALPGTLSGCSGEQSPEAGPEAFPGSAASLAEMGERALEGLTARDTATIFSIRLTESEHNDVVWPELPASSPEANFPVDFAWTNISLRNRRAVARLLPRLRGRAATMRGVECRGETQTFQTFVVHTDCWVEFELDDGTRVEAQLFKDVLERGGGFKIFRYYEEPYLETSEDGKP